jgi:hypothetical protein
MIIDLSAFGLSAQAGTGRRDEGGKIFEFFLKKRGRPPFPGVPKHESAAQTRECKSKKAQHRDRFCVLTTIQHVPIIHPKKHPPNVARNSFSRLPQNVQKNPLPKTRSIFTIAGKPRQTT